VTGPVDSLDHSSRLPNFGSKMGIDATRKWPGEGFTRPWPGVIEMTRSSLVRRPSGRIARHSTSRGLRTKAYMSPPCARASAAGRDGARREKTRPQKH